MKFINDENQKKLRVVAKMWNNALDLEREIDYFADPALRPAIGTVKQAANQIAKLLGIPGPDFRDVPWHEHPRIVRKWIEDNGLS